MTPGIPSRVPKLVSKLVDISRSDASNLDWLDVVRHQVWHPSRPFRSQWFSSEKVLRLSAYVHSSF
jgi:hypothetical protein